MTKVRCVEEQLAASEKTTNQCKNIDNSSDIFQTSATKPTRITVIKSIKQLRQDVTFWNIEIQRIKQYNALALDEHEKLVCI